MPLLHELVRGASSAECPFARECCRVLRVLTRHDFPVGDAAWRKWYSDHADKHPIYTTPLDRAVKLCIDTFRFEHTTLLSKSLDNTAFFFLCILVANAAQPRVQLDCLDRNRVDI